MLKKAEKLLNKLKGSVLTLILGILAAVFIGFGGIFFLVLPQYSALTEVQEKNRIEQEKLNNIKKNLAAVKKLDKGNLATYSATVDKLLPDQPDHIRVATVLQIVASKVGGSISNIQASSVSSIKPTTNAPSTGTSVPPQKQTIGGTQTTVPTTSTAGSKTSQTFEMTIIFSGSYSSLRNFLDGLKQTDRVLEVKSIEVASGDDPNRLKTTMSLSIPILSVPLAQVQPEAPFSSLSATEEKEIDEIAQKILHKGTAATDPVSRNNPFANY